MNNTRMVRYGYAKNCPSQALDLDVGTGVFSSLRDDCQCSEYGGRRTRNAGLSAQKT